MPGARDGGGHIWLQQSFDQNGIVRQYTKWDHRMELQDNAGLMISRALQVARTEPCGPVYLTLPREVSLHKIKGAKFPTMDQLGVARPAAPDAEGIREIARRLVKADNPFVLVARSGRNPATVPALVRLCELMALPVAQSGLRAYQCFPLNHPLYMSGASLKDADVSPRARRRYSLARRLQSAAGQRLGGDDRRRAGEAPHPDHGVHRRPAAHRRRAAR